jgi:tRNA-dihydrouridine synthase 1
MWFTNIVRTLDEGLSVPVTCKIRIFKEEEKTLKYAKMLENAGCKILTVHGRLREQKGHNSGKFSFGQKVESTKVRFRIG